MAVCQNLVPLVNIKIAGKWMFIPLKMVLIGIDPYSNLFSTLANILNRARFFTVQALLGVASEAWTLPGDRDPILCLSIASWFWYKKPSCQLKPSRICQLKDWKHPIFCPTVSLGLHSHATMQESFIMILNPRPNSHTSPQHHHKSKLTVRLRSTAALDILISIFRATLIVYSQSVFLPDEPFRITPFFSLLQWNCGICGFILALSSCSAIHCWPCVRTFSSGSKTVTVHPHRAFARRGKVWW